jgi:hypothetical protein
VPPTANGGRGLVTMEVICRADPGVQFSRTRLSDKAVLHILLHTFAHERLPLRSLELV